MEIELHIEEVEIERRWERLHALRGRGNVVGRFLSFRDDHAVVWLDAFPTREQRLAPREPLTTSSLVLRSTIHTLIPAYGSTITQLHEFDRIAESPIIELRLYRIVPGLRRRFASFFRDCALEAQARCGMTVYGQFDSLEDENLFVWMRGFPSLLERERRKAEFYQSRLWLEELQDEAFSMIEDYRNNLLLTPVLNGA